jgi:hypothetical protein
MRLSTDPQLPDGAMDSPVDQLNVYGYQITPQSRLRVRTSAGETFALQNYPSCPTGFEGQLVVTDSSRQDLIGCVGFPFGGIGIGRSFRLCGLDRGMVSAPVKRLQASNILSDTITSSALELYQQYESRLPIGQELLDDLCSAQHWLNQGESPVLSLRPVNRQQTDAAALRSKIGSMVRGIIACIDQREPLPFDSEQISHLQQVFSTLIWWQCYDFSGGIVKLVERKFTVPDSQTGQPAPHRLWSGFLLSGDIQNFKVEREAR